MKKHDILIVVERLLAISVGRSNGTSTNDSIDIAQLSQSAYSQFINHIEKTYGVTLTCKQRLNCEQIADICYLTCRNNALKNVKRIIETYDIKENELFVENNCSIH